MCLMDGKGGGWDGEEGGVGSGEGREDPEREDNPSPLLRADRWSELQSLG